MRGGCVWVAVGDGGDADVTGDVSGDVVDDDVGDGGDVVDDVGIRAGVTPDTIMALSLLSLWIYG